MSEDQLYFLHTTGRSSFNLVTTHPVHSLVITASTIDVSLCFVRRNRRMMFVCLCFCQMPRLQPESISMIGLNLFQQLCHLARSANASLDSPLSEEEVSSSLFSSICLPLSGETFSFWHCSSLFPHPDLSQDISKTAQRNLIFSVYSMYYR